MNTGFYQGSHLKSIYLNQLPWNLQWNAAVESKGGYLNMKPNDWIAITSVDKSLHFHAPYILEENYKRDNFIQPIIRCKKKTIFNNIKVPTWPTIKHNKETIKPLLQVLLISTTLNHILGFY